MSGLNADSKRFLDDVFGDASKAWVIRGRYNAKDKLEILEEGPAGSFALSDDEDIYYCVATVDGARTNPKRVYALVIDDVGKEIDRDEFEFFCPLEPSVRRLSSKGSMQVKFRIRGGMDVEDFKVLRQRMKTHPTWGKAHNISAAAIYRLPQGTHTKSTRNGWKVYDETCADVDYLPEELEAFVPKGTPAGLPVVKRYDWDLGNEALAELVDLIPNPPEVDDRDDWVWMGHQIMGAGGTLEIFDAWSQKWGSGYNAWDTENFWEGIVPASVKAGGGMLRDRVEKLDPEGFQKWKVKHETKRFEEPSQGDLGDVPVDEKILETQQQDVAEHLIRQHGHSIRYNVDTALWHKFNGAVWAPTKHELGFQLAAAWARNATGLSKGMKAAVKKITFPSAVEGYMRRDARLMVEATDFDKDPWLLGTPGGTVDLRTGKLRPALPGDMISKCTTVTPAETEDCPIWKKRLIGWMTTVGTTVDMEMQKFLQQWAGYCLTGDTSEEKLLFLYGHGANGKGSYVETLAKIMGTYFQEPDQELFIAKKHSRHRQEIAVLAGARMISATEVPATADWDETFLKKVTGGGTISANFMRQNSFEFPIQFKITVSGNDKPTFRGRISEAIRRRFLLATFPNIAKPIDTTFKPGLLREAPGILRWAINGLVDKLANGLMVPQSVMDATDKYMEDEDLFGTWIKEKVQKVIGGQAKPGDMLNSWREFRNAEGNHVLIDTQRKFGEEMRERGFHTRRTSAGDVYANVTLKATAVFD